MRTKNFFKRVAITLLIAVFSIAGVVACSGADITSSVGGDTGGGTSSPVSPDYPNSPADAYAADTYRSIYVPFGAVHTKKENGDWNWNYAKVSYMDRDTLTQLWKDQMDYKSENGVDFFLRNANNAFQDFKGTGKNDYYFFDADFNIRHKKYPNVVIKEFVGGVMTMYYHDDPGSTSKGTITIGGLYKTALDNTSRVGNDRGIGYFLNGRSVGDLEVLMLNVGATQASFTYFGLDITYYTGTSRAYSGLETFADEWYKESSDPEKLVQVLRYDTMRNKYKADGRNDGSYFYFSKGKAEITR